ncbi:MAG: hypothetical protein NTX52_04775 [Planctomycetota bacterium]|nr:hypothetical protein [Planctomycetota bacterium]
MIDGLWTVEFSSSLGLSGNGVVVIKDKRLLGGDVGYYYHGTFDLIDGNFTGKLTITRYDRNIVSVFGDIDEFSFNFTGKFIADEFQIEAKVGEYRFQSRGKKKVDF